jgi:hypothetical protein
VGVYCEVAVAGEFLCDFDVLGSLRDVNRVANELGQWRTGCAATLTFLRRGPLCMAEARR